MTGAIELANVSKVYRKYSGRQFATLKSALLRRSLLRDLRPDEAFLALKDVSFSVPKGSTFGVIGRNLMPELPGFTRENISVKRDRVVFRYSF